MFLKLTNARGQEEIFINFDHVVSMKRENFAKPEGAVATSLDMTYGSKVVLESPEEIMKMLSGGT